MVIGATPTGELPWTRRRYNRVLGGGGRVLRTVCCAFPVVGAANPSLKGDLSDRRAVGRRWSLRASQRGGLPAVTLVGRRGAGEQTEGGCDSPPCLGELEVWIPVSKGHHLIPLTPRERICSSSVPGSGSGGVALVGCRSWCFYLHSLLTAAPL